MMSLLENNGPFMVPRGAQGWVQSRCLWSYRQGRDKGLGCSPGSHWAPADAPAPKAGCVRFPCGKYRNMGKQNKTLLTRLTSSPRVEIHLASELLPSPLSSSPRQASSLCLLSSEKWAGSRSSSTEHCQVPGATVPCCVCEFQSPALSLDTWHLWDEASLCGHSGLCPRSLGSCFLSPAAAPQMRCFVQRPVASSTGN